MLNRVTTSGAGLDQYRGIISDELYDSISERSANLRGLRIAHINATPEGGGVAEMLKSLIPLKRSVGIQADWYTLPPNDRFFAVTKQFHNALQSKRVSLSKKDFDCYVRHNAYTAELMRDIPADIWVIHDPQPLATMTFLHDARPAIWRCHIDTSNPDPAVRDFLLPYLGAYDHLIFSLPEYVFPQLTTPNIHFFAPAIDPLAVKNNPIPREEARRRMAELGLDSSRPIATQVSRFDPWKDPWGVIDAYRLAKQRIPDLQLALVGVIAAQDDPEALTILEDVIAYAGQDPDIHLFTDPAEVNGFEVNAFQSGSDVVIQKSVREGFGLTVAEAMWKGAPVIGGDCGGIRLQIDDGVNGWLVNGAHHCAERIVDLLSDRPLAEQMGVIARESVREKYLLPRLLLDYLDLLSDVVETREEMAA